MRTGVRELVMISTDKAVNPTSVMGLTKRAAELYVHQVGNGAGTTSCTTVRFGNVCGSSGSVIPLFVEQVRRGGPLTLTHPDVVRYLMTIPEAVSLVLQASWLGVGEPAGIYVLDMGAPVRVQLIAERVCHHLGKTLHDDIAIEIIGLRPGEKLFEELAYADERPEPTARPGISRVTASAAPVVSADWMALLKTYSDERKAADVLRLLTDLVPQYRSAPCV